jgi:translocation and assembly module TamB
MPKYKIQDEEFSKPRPVRKKGLFRLRNLFMAFLILLIVGVGIGGPMAVSNRGLVVSLANKYAGIAPFRIDLQSISVGWMQSLRIQGLRLIDQAGVDLVKIDEIETQRGMWSIARNYHDLGLVTIRGAAMQIDIQPGTTSIEEALKPLMSMPTTTEAAPQQPTATSTKMPVGRIRIEKALVAARDSVDGSAWQLVIEEADIPLPDNSMSVPPVNLVGMIVQQANPQNANQLAQGRFTIRTQLIAGAVATPSGIPPMQMTIATTDLPLEWYSLVKRRMPGLSIDRINGQATIQADIEMQSPKDIRAKIATAQIDRLSIIAPDLIGKEGAALKQIRVSGIVKMNQDRLVAENAILESDVGNLGIAASLPTNFVSPSATQPWIPDAQWDVQGNVDVARLLKVAPGMIPMQENTQLTRGKMSLMSSQKLVAGNPQGSHRVELGDLVANVSGNPMTWENALKASLDIERQSNGQAKFLVDCSAEFCEVKGQGDLQAGSLTSKVDLDQLHQRLAKWFALPLSQLSGNADMNVTWKQATGNRITAEGTLNTTPMRIGLAHGRLNEPAWKGNFQAIATFDGSRLLQIDRGSLVLDSDGESLRAELQEPLTWTAPAPGAAPLPPAGMIIELSGDMNAWQKRGQIVAGIDPGLTIEGRCDLKATGAIDTKHVEITTASFSAQPLTLRGEGFAMRESRVEGSFNGRFDSSDVAKLQVEKLLVQAESFALTAKDSASVNGVGREGKAAFRLEPKRLMSAMNSGDGNAPQSMALEGDITGTANWLLDPANDIRWQLTVDGKDIRVLQPTPNPARIAPGQLVSTRGNDSAMSLVWEEALAKATTRGSYNFKSGRLELPESTIQTVWMAYGGATTIETSTDGMRAIANGQMTYDAAVVAEKLRPFTGDYLKVTGQRTEPVEVTWQSSPSGNWADSLQAKMQLGWDGASIIGIDIGKADVPIVVQNGQFKSKTTIPVSQGAMRWDLDSHLGGNPLTIQQAPEMVLEGVAITPQMCQGWLKYVAPLVADVTSVQGQLSLQIDRAIIVPADSLKQTIAGNLLVKDVTVGPGPLANQLLTIVQQVQALRKGASGQSPSQSGAWLQMPEQNIQFAMQEGKVVHRNLRLRAGDVEITTDGSVSVDGQLELIAKVQILKDWVDGTPALASLAGQSIQVPIRGTIQRPQLDMNAFASIGRQVAESAVQGAVQKQLDKGLNKLLGPLESKLGPLQQNLQQSLPQLPSFPGGFQIPGFGSPQPAPAPAPVPQP